MENVDKEKSIKFRKSENSAIEKDLEYEGNNSHDKSLEKSNKLVLDEKTEHKAKSNHESVIFPQATLSWKDIKMTSKPTKKQEAKTILHSVEGVVHTGEVCAILGASGAGKTTLLNRLSHKIDDPTLHFEGDIMVNDHRLSKDDFQALSCYVMQDDFLEPSMTPDEILLFTAKLRLNLPVEEIEKKVDEMILSLNLKRARSTPIGGGLNRGVSGGERKRTSIGVELITDPNVIFLDEPTTGLDSYNAFELVHLLKEISLRGKIVIFTIHQPSSEIFEIIDKLCLMALGKTIFFGDKNQAAEHFDLLKMPIPTKYNPFEHFIEMTNIMSIEIPSVAAAYPKAAELPDQETKYQALVSEMAQKFQEKKDNYYTMEVMNSVLPKEFTESIKQNKKGKNLFFQYWMLTLKLVMRNLRMESGIMTRIIRICITGALVSSIYSGMGIEQTSIYDKNGVLSIISMQTIMEAISSQVLVFTTDHKVYERERANKLYRFFPYFAAKFHTQLSNVFILSNLTVMIIYYAADINSTMGIAFWKLLYTIFIGCICGTSLATFLASMADSEEVLSNLQPLIVVPSMLLNGFFARAENFMPWIWPFQYLSIFKYVFQAAALIGHESEQYYYCSNGNQEMNVAGCDPYEILDIKEPLWVNILLIFVFIGVFNLLAILIFVIRKKT